MMVHPLPIRDSWVLFQGPDGNGRGITDVVSRFDWHALLAARWRMTW